MATRLRRLHDDESGSVLLLILGFGVVVLALALVVASISALHIDRKQLAAAADAAAADAASLLDREAYLGAESADFFLGEGQVTERVAAYLADYGPALGIDGLTGVSASVGEDGRTVTVTLTAEARVPFLPSLVPGITHAIPIQVTSTARGH